MKVLLLENDKAIRDQILVGLQIFPEFEVECGVGYKGLNRTRHTHFNCLFLGCDPEDGEGLEMLEHFREYDGNTEVVLVTSMKKTKALMSQRGRLNISAILHVPLDRREFFRIAARLRRRSLAT